MMTAWSWSWDGGPAYAAHATLGSVIGHEILHAFDLHRRRLPLDPDMNVDQWLWITPESWKRLEARIECVARLYARSFWRKVQFYGNDVAVQVGKTIYIYICVCTCVYLLVNLSYEVAVVKSEGWNVFQFDWNVTRNENVADIGALQISYKTWHTLTNGKDRSLPGLEGLRASQLFFISAAQVNKQTGRRISSIRDWLLSSPSNFYYFLPFRIHAYRDILNSTCRSYVFNFPLHGGWPGAFCEKKNFPFFLLRIRGPISKHSYAQPFRISLHFYDYFFSIVFLFFVALSKINIRHGGDFLRFLALNVVFNFFNLKQHLEEDIFLKGTINTGLLSSFPDLLFQYDCRGLHSFRWARLPHTSARKVLNQSLILVSRSNETLDNIDIVISFWNTRVNGIMMNSQAFADAFRCPLGTKMNPPNKCTTWWWRSGLDVQFADNVSDSSHDNSIIGYGVVWLWHVKSEEKRLKGFKLFFFNNRRAILRRRESIRVIELDLVERKENSFILYETVRKTN